MTPSVFITRDLATDSIFATQLKQNGYRVFGQSLIAFSPIAFSAIPNCQWIFFYSKNGVDFFFEHLKRLNLSAPKVAYAAMGVATSKHIEKHGQTVDFEGTGHPATTAAKFVLLAKGQTVIFPQALHSRQSIQQLLKDQIRAENLVVYDNQIKSNISIPDCDYLVFTSPLNAKAYLQNKAIHSDQKIIAIGASTATELLALGIIQPIKIAKKPSELALLKAIKSMKL